MPLEVLSDASIVKFDEKGLVPAVVQDVVSGKVLMLAYMNKQALEKTLETGFAHYWSRSRKKLWKKGETSGNVQEVVTIYYDCDEDALLLKVKQTGVACHTGNFSCFYRTLAESDEIPDEESPSVLQELFEVIMERKRTMPENSYVAKKMREGLDRILKKIGEEAGEFIIASKNENQEEIVYELADLIFHAFLTLGWFEIPPSEVWKELRKRRR